MYCKGMARRTRCCCRPLLLAWLWKGVRRGYGIELAENRVLQADVCIEWAAKQHEELYPSERQATGTPEIAVGNARKVRSSKVLRY